MERKKVKVINAKSVNGYVCTWVEINGETLQIANKDEWLLDSIGKDVYLSKENGKDYRFEPIAKKKK